MESLHECGICSVNTKCECCNRIDQNDGKAKEKKLKDKTPKNGLITLTKIKGRLVKMWNKKSSGTMLTPFGVKKRNVKPCNTESDGYRDDGMAAVVSYTPSLFCNGGFCSGF